MHADVGAVRHARDDGSVLTVPIPLHRAPARAHLPSVRVPTESHSALTAPKRRHATPRHNTGRKAKVSARGRKPGSSECRGRRPASWEFCADAAVPLGSCCEGCGHPAASHRAFDHYSPFWAVVVKHSTMGGTPAMHSDEAHVPSNCVSFARISHAKDGCAPEPRFSRLLHHSAPRRAAARPCTGGQGEGGRAWLGVADAPKQGRARDTRACARGPMGRTRSHLGEAHAEHHDDVGAERKEPAAHRPAAEGGGRVVDLDADRAERRDDAAGAGRELKPRHETVGQGGTPRRRTHARTHTHTGAGSRFYSIV